VARPAQQYRKAARSHGGPASRINSLVTGASPSKHAMRHPPTCCTRPQPGYRADASYVSNAPMAATDPSIFMHLQSRTTWIAIRGGARSIGSVRLTDDASDPVIKATQRTSNNAARYFLIGLHATSPEAEECHDGSPPRPANRRFDAGSD
jgi:hypothetical protein